ncbi:branched-chain amino acid ABC transporter permease, partial [Desulfovibrio sp. OttesenSCG-928-C14]|nr:branched-chain amino acid ABC transporter permease [Desulfovibrio sp. OttesenSCG-928-C14]
MSLKAKYFIVLAILAALLWLAETQLRDYHLRLLIQFGLTAIIATGVNLTNGYTNIFSLGFGGTMLVAGYTTALLTLPVEYKAQFLDLPLWLEQLRVPFPLAMLTAGLLGMLASIVLLLPAFRLRGQYFILASMGINIVFENLAENVRWLTHGNLGLRGIPKETNIWWVFGILIVTLYCLHRLMKSRHGDALRVISKDQDLASVMGVNVARYKILSFALGSFISSIGAALWCHQVLVINPKAFSLLYVFQIIAMIAIGGTGTLTGPIIGAAILMIGTELLTPLQEGFTAFGISVPPAFGAINVFTALLLVLIMIF